MFDAGYVALKEALQFRWRTCTGITYPVDRSESIINCNRTYSDTFALKQEKRIVAIAQLSLPN
jgi:hypothetical protein